MKLQIGIHQLAAGVVTKQVNDGLNKYSIYMHVPQKKENKTD